MADNVTLDPGADGATIATDDVGGFHYQRVKLDGGGDGASVPVLATTTAPAGTAAGLATRPILRKSGAILSTTPLAGDGVLSQAWQDANADGAVFVAAVARADVASATNGFVIQETDDDSDANFTRTVAQTSVSGDTTTFIYGAIRGRKWRVQYTNGAGAQASFKITTTAASWESLRDALPTLVSGRLPVDGSGVTQPVSATSLPLPTGAATAAKQDTEIASLASIDGKITAVNTGAVVVSGSSLPTGAATEATLASMLTALQIMDDWDESDRAKVNTIAGQVGVQGGAGTVTALTQRVALATDANTIQGTVSATPLVSGKTIKRAVVSLTADGDVVAAVTDKKIRVLHYAIQSKADSIVIQLKDGSGGSAVTAAWKLNDREGVSGPAVTPPHCLWIGSTNTALYLDMTGTGTVVAEVSYYDDDN